VNSNLLIKNPVVKGIQSQLADKQGIGRPYQGFTDATLVQ
jgi:hypothetical protein